MGLLLLPLRLLLLFTVVAAYGRCPWLIVPNTVGVTSIHVRRFNVTDSSVDTLPKCQETCWKTRRCASVDFTPLTSLADPLCQYYTSHPGRLDNSTITTHARMYRRWEDGYMKKISILPREVITTRNLPGTNDRCASACIARPWCWAYDTLLQDGDEDDDCRLFDVAGPLDQLVHKDSLWIYSRMVCDALPDQYTTTSDPPVARPECPDPNSPGVNAANWAYGRPTRAANNVAAGAVDANTRDFWSGGTCFRSEEGTPDPWMVVYLEKPVLVRRYLLTPMFGCCNGWNMKISVEVGYTDSGGNVVWQICHKYTSRLIRTRKDACLQPVCGHLVRITDYGAGTILMVCNFEVYGDVLAPTTPARTILAPTTPARTTVAVYGTAAESRPTTAATTTTAFPQPTCDGWPNDAPITNVAPLSQNVTSTTSSLPIVVADSLTDGRPDTCFTMAVQDQAPYVRIDLRDNTRITGFGFRGAITHEASDVYVFYIGHLSSPIRIRWEHAFTSEVPAATAWNTTLASPTCGNFVFVRKLNATRLTVCEILVYGNDAGTANVTTNTTSSARVQRSSWVLIALIMLHNSNLGGGTTHDVTTMILVLVIGAWATTAYQVIPGIIPGSPGYSSATSRACASGSTETDNQNWALSAKETSARSINPYYLNLDLSWTNDKVLRAAVNGRTDRNSIWFCTETTVRNDPPWYIVFLRQSVQVRRFVLGWRSDCCSNYNRNLTIEVGHQISRTQIVWIYCNHKPDSAPGDPPWEASCVNGYAICGDRIRVTGYQANTALSLCNLEIYSTVAPLTPMCDAWKYNPGATNVNWVYERPVATPTVQKFAGELAVDEFTANTFLASTCSESSVGVSNPWLSIYLTRPVLVTRFSLGRRVSYYADRNKNVTLEIGVRSTDGWSVAWQYCNNWLNDEVSPPAINRGTCKYGALCGDAVRVIDYSSSTTLSICNLEIYGSVEVRTTTTTTTTTTPATTPRVPTVCDAWSSASESNTNWAFERPTNFSSEDDSRPGWTSKAVDANKEIAWDACSYSKEETNPWIAVFFARPVLITRYVISGFSRTDGRNKNVTLEVWFPGGLWRHCNSHASLGRSTSAKCASGRICGDRIRVVDYSQNTTLHICNLEVYGEVDGEVDMATTPRPGIINPTPSTPRSAPQLNTTNNNSSTSAAALERVHHYILIVALLYKIATTQNY